MSTKGFYAAVVREIYDPKPGFCNTIQQCAVLAQGAGYKLFNWSGTIHQIIKSEDVGGVNSLPLQVGKGNVFYLKLEIEMTDLKLPNMQNIQNDKILWELQKI